MFENKQRRLSGWDYSSPGYYFITINAKHHECNFGHIENDIVTLSDIGKIIKYEWQKSFEIRKELNCDCYIIMPNHIHAIIQIGDTFTPTPVSTIGRSCLRERYGRSCLRERYSCSHLRGQQRVMMKPKSISSFVAGFKSSATTKINEFRKTPYLSVWQSRFYDHIIRDEEELNCIREYIIYNPLKWNVDDNNPINIKK